MIKYYMPSDKRSHFKLEIKTGAKSIGGMIDTDTVPSSTFPCFKYSFFTYTCVIVIIFILELHYLLIVVKLNIYLYIDTFNT